MTEITKNIKVSTETAERFEKFTTEQEADKGRELQAQLDAIEKLEGRQKRINKMIKDRMAKLNAERRNLTDMLRARGETISYECLILKDFENFEVLHMEKDTGEVIKRRKMNEQERQKSMQEADIKHFTDDTGRFDLIKARYHAS
ncbi:hypothetical protein V6R21_20025 [Limibacter armeniacum]|uniref:hypothetical protein n=1 Tax=Limibacter armeniacum TaxID=466084 RepID=UPI002FE55BFF